MGERDAEPRRRAPNYRKYTDSSDDVGDKHLGRAGRFIDVMCRAECERSARCVLAKIHHVACDDELEEKLVTSVHPTVFQGLRSVLPLHLPPPQAPIEMVSS